MKLNFVTTNKGKFFLVSKFLSNFGIEIVYKPLEILEIRNENIEKIAIDKAETSFKILKEPLIVIDSGFFIGQTNFPGPYVNFVMKNIGIDGILTLSKSFTDKAHFKNVLAYIDNYIEIPVIFSSVVNGKISNEPKGVMKNFFWSDLFKVFIPEGSIKTLSEMENEEYFKWVENSSTNDYLRQFAEWLVTKGLNS